MVTHLEKIRCERLAAAREAGRSESADEAYGYLSRLLVYLHPDIHLLDDLMGVCTQIDHEIANLRAENERLRQALQGNDETVSYILRYGGRCRGCADEDGICPIRGLPCENPGKAVRFVLEALNYGISHGYLPSALAAVRGGD